MLFRIAAVVLALLSLALPALGGTVTLYGKLEADTSQTHLDLGAIRVSDLTRLRGYLRQLPNLKTVDMYSSRLSVKDAEALMADFPGVRFGLTLSFVKGPLRTDQVAYSTQNSLSDPRYSEKKFAALRHCPRMRALDLGHNAIRDLSFLTAMPELRVLILADNDFTDLSPLSQLKHLQYLELFLNDFTDLTPLAGLTELLDLNICRVRVSDVTPLLGLKNLRRLWLPDNFLTPGQKAELEQALPDCQIVYEWSRSTDHGWRDHPRYDQMRAMFATNTFTPFAP